jgi:hypothetical protein
MSSAVARLWKNCRENLLRMSRDPARLRMTRCDGVLSPLRRRYQTRPGSLAARVVVTLSKEGHQSDTDTLF